MKILAVLGTRPEIIKTAPVLKALSFYPAIETRLCLSSQHTNLLIPFLNFFKLKVHYDLKIQNQNLPPQEIAHRVSRQLEKTLTLWNPDLIVVQGDTSTALGASLEAAHTKIPLAHIEAGLRSPDKNSPWPEEENRRLIDSLAQIHFAPTPLSAQNLLQEGLSPSRIFVTGNTGLDSFLETLKQIENTPRLKRKLDQKWNFLGSSRKLIFSTFHRRENLGIQMEKIFDVLIALTQNEKVQIIYPVHPRPSIRALANKKLEGRPHLFLTPPLDYFSCAYLMQKSHLIITDSGGIQEEATVLGKPLILARANTERPESILKSASIMAPTPQDIGLYVKKLIETSALYRKMARPRFLYGNGNAGQKIARILASVMPSLKPAGDKPRNRSLNEVSPNFPFACG